MQDLPQRSRQDRQLVPGVAGEGDALAAELLRALGHVQRVVGDTLKIRQRV